MAEKCGVRVTTERYTWECYLAKGHPGSVASRDGVVRHMPGHHFRIVKDHEAGEHS